MGSNIFSLLGWAISTVVQVLANVITVFVGPGSSSGGSGSSSGGSGGSGSTGGSGSGGSSGGSAGNPRLNNAEANFFADLYGNQYTVLQLLSMFSIDTSNANSSDPLNVYGYYVGYDPSATMTPAQFIAIPYGGKTGTDLTQQIRGFLVGQLNSYILQHPNYQAYLANKTDTTIQLIRTNQNTPSLIPHEISINRKTVVPQLQGLQYITDDQLMGAAVVALNNPAYSSDIKNNLMAQQQQMLEGAGFGGQISYNLFNIYFSNSTNNFANPPMDPSVLGFVQTYNYMPQGVVIAGVLYPNGATGVVENFQTAFNAVLAEIQAPYQPSTGINLFADQTLIWELMVNFGISDITSLMSMYSNRRQESINELFGLSSSNPIFNFFSNGSSASFGLALQNTDPYVALKQSINLSAMTNGSTQNNPSPAAKILLASANPTTAQIQQWINEYGCYSYQFFCLAAQQMNAIYSQIMSGIQQNVSYTPGANEITKQENKFNLVNNIAVNAAGDNSIMPLANCLDLLSMRIDALPSSRPNSWVMYQIHRGGYSSNSAYLSNNGSLLYTPSPDFRNLWINEISQIVNGVFSDPSFLSNIRSGLMTCVDSAASFASPLNNMYQVYAKDPTKQAYISQLQQVFSVANTTGFHGKSYFDFANQNMNIAYLAQDYNFFDLTFPINVPKYLTNKMSLIVQGPTAKEAKSITDGPSLRAWISSKAANPNYTQAIEMFVQGFIAKTLLDLTWWQMYNLTYVYPADDYWRQIATVTPLAPRQNVFSSIVINPDGSTSDAPPPTPIPPFTQNGTSILLGQHRFAYGVPSSLTELTATAFFGSPNGATHASGPGYASGGDNAGYWGAWRVANIAMYGNINSNLVPSDDWITRQAEVGIQYSSAIKGVTGQNAIGAYENGLYGDVCGASNATNGVYSQQNSAFSASNSAQVQDFNMQSIFSPIMQQISTLYTITTSGGWSLDYTNMISNYQTPVIAMHWAYSLGITEINVGVRQGDIDQSTKYFQDLTNNQSIVVGGVAPPPGTIIPPTADTGASGSGGGANQAAGGSASSTGASGNGQATGGSGAGATSGTQVTTITTIGSTMITNNLYKDIMLSTANFANSNPRSQFCSAFLCNPFTHLSKGTSQYYQMTFDKKGSPSGYAYGGTRQTGIDPSLEPAYIVMPGDSSPHYDVQQQILNKMANDSQLNYRTGGMTYHNALAFTYFMETLNIPYNTDFNS